MREATECLAIDLGTARAAGGGGKQPAAPRGQEPNTARPNYSTVIRRNATAVCCVLTVVL